MPEPIARWSTTHDCWLMFDDETESLFSVPSAVFSETFPISGMTVAGMAYELPTSAHPTDGSASSCLPTLLPTPDASPEKYRLGGDSQQSRSLPAMAIRGEPG